MRGGSRPVHGAGGAGRAGDGGDDTGWCDLADRAIGVVHDIEVAARVQGHVRRIIETCGGTRPVGVPGAGSARQGGHDDARGHLADRVVAGVRNIDVAAGIRADPEGIIVLGGGSRPVHETRGLQNARDGGHHAARRDLPDQDVIVVTDIHVATAVHRHALRGVEPRGGPRPVGASVLARGPREGRHRARRGDHADRAVSTVPYVEVAASVHRYGGGIAEARNNSLAVDAPGDPRCARKGGHDSGRRDLADRVVHLVNDKQGSASVHHDADRVVELRGRPGAVIVAEAPRGPREGGHDAARRDLADRVVARVRDKNVAASVHGDAERTVELRGRSRPVIASDDPRGARQGGHDAGRRDLADRVVQLVRDINVAAGVGRNPARGVKLRGGPRPVRSAGHVGGACKRGERVGRRVDALGVGGRRREQDRGEGRNEADQEPCCRLQGT